MECVALHNRIHEYLHFSYMEINNMTTNDFLNIIGNKEQGEKRNRLMKEMEQEVIDRNTISNDEKKFCKLLGSIGRDGTDKLLDALKVNHFFTAPASVRHHNNAKGGLVKHSLDVYECAMNLREQMLAKDPSLEDELNIESITVASLLHDVCKCDEYSVSYEGKPTKLKSHFPIGGHGTKSVIYILGWNFHLLSEEILAIRWHMGGKRITDEKLKKVCEKAMKLPLCRLIAAADHMASTENT